MEAKEIVVGDWLIVVDPAMKPEDDFRLEPTRERKQFDLIYADPPWKYFAAGAITGKKGCRRAMAQSHYPTMTVEEMVKEFRPSIDAWAAPDCGLACWCTWPKLPDLCPLLSGWGFEYVTCLLVWVKTRDPVDENQGTMFPADFSNPPKKGLGFYSRLDTEFCIYARRGKGLELPVNRNVGQTFFAEGETLYDPVRQHSRKPDEARKRLELLWPKARKLELFAREQVPGWAVFGNETAKFGRAEADPLA